MSHHRNFSIENGLITNPEKQRVAKAFVEAICSSQLSDGSLQRLMRVFEEGRPLIREDMQQLEAIFVRERFHSWGSGGPTDFAQVFKDIDFINHHRLFGSGQTRTARVLCNFLKAILLEPQRQDCMFQEENARKFLEGASDLAFSSLDFQYTKQPYAEVPPPHRCRAELSSELMDDIYKEVVSFVAQLRQTMSRDPRQTFGRFVSKKSFFDYTTNLDRRSFLIYLKGNEILVIIKARTVIGMPAPFRKITDKPDHGIFFSAGAQKIVKTRGVRLTFSFTEGAPLQFQNFTPIVTFSHPVKWTASRVKSDSAQAHFKENRIDYVGWEPLLFADSGSSPRFWLCQESAGSSVGKHGDYFLAIPFHEKMKAVLTFLQSFLPVLRSGILPRDLKFENMCVSNGCVGIIDYQNAAGATYMLFKKNASFSVYVTNKAISFGQYQMILARLDQRQLNRPHYLFLVRQLAFEIAFNIFFILNPDYFKNTLNLWRFCCWEVDFDSSQIIDAVEQVEQVERVERVKKGVSLVSPTSLHFKRLLKKYSSNNLPEENNFDFKGFFRAFVLDLTFFFRQVDSDLIKAGVYSAPVVYCAGGGEMEVLSDLWNQEFIRLVQELPLTCNPVDDEPIVKIQMI